MSKVVIVGAGGVGKVVATKCAMLANVFTDIVLASRTVSKCEAIAAEVHGRTGVAIRTAALDADDVSATVALLERERPALLINVALPYQDLVLMDACLAAGVHYLDTANYEPPDVAKFEYHWQWAYEERFREAGLMALLGCGFDPGVTNVFTAFARKHRFEAIERLDIVDCNAGDHGQPFATNFNPEINIREVTAKGRYHQDGSWREIEPLSVRRTFDFPEGIGERAIYLLYHEELESLTKHFPEIRRARFWMTFGDEYIKHLEVLGNVGMTSIEPVMHEGREIVPLQFLKTLLPDPGSLGPLTEGRTCIGILADGARRTGASPDAPTGGGADGGSLDGEGTYYVYNICDHAECYAEVGSQAVSYTTGVPAMIGAKLMLEGTWREAGVRNVEQLDPDPFMADLNAYGLPWTETLVRGTGLDEPVGS